MKRVVTYLMSGTGYLPYLLVSLNTLRRYYGGPIQVIAYEESYPIVRRMAEDGHLNFTPRLLPMSESIRGRNSQFINKIQVCQQADCGVRLYIDADTSFRGPVEPLFQMAESHRMVITQFNQWMTNSHMIQGRIKGLRQFPEIPQGAVEQTLAISYPSPNGGIFAVTPSSIVLPRWHHYSIIARGLFICDEAVLHILPQIFDSNEITVERSGRYNCSHKWMDQVKDPIIMHYHGNSCSRPGKSPRAVDEWWPLYEECLENNIGFVSEWINQVENKWFEELKKDADFKYAALLPA